MRSQSKFNSLSRRAFMASGTAGALALSVHHGSGANLSSEEVRQIALDAYVYGYSLITTHVTRIQQSNVPNVEQLASPMGVFLNMKAYPPASFRGVSATN